VRPTLAALDAAEPGIHAFATVARESALLGAEAIDRAIARGEKVGSRAGIPVAIKDLVLTKGLRTTFARDSMPAIPEDDDIAVERLKRADAIVIGKSNASDSASARTDLNFLGTTLKEIPHPW
jgi:aspartyl-tRNA(Asn)/glutamyl-tRNA(Gln) amidotransferase subunit A